VDHGIALHIYGEICRPGFTYAHRFRVGLGVSLQGPVPDRATQTYVLRSSLLMASIGGWTSPTVFYTAKNVLQWPSQGSLGDISSSIAAF
jgi:hypothetical protein